MNGILKTSMVLLGLALFAACSNDSDEQSQQPPQKTTYPLTIEVTENPLIQDGAEGSNSNRAAITTNSTLSSFKLNYAFNSTCSTEDPVTATKDTEGKWTSEGSWPDIGESSWEDVQVTWYAKTGGTLYLDGSNPYISFSVEEASSNQSDLLVATARGSYNDTFDGTTNKLAFTFDHACSALRFYVKKSTNLNNYRLDITSIKLCNVVKVGNYYYNYGLTPSWTPTATRTAYTISSALSDLGSASYVLLNGTETDSYLFMIPQTLTAWDHTTAIASATTQTYLEVECTITNTSTSTQVHSGKAYVPFGTTFVAGKKYDVKINIGKNSLYSGPNTKIIND